VHLKGKKVKQNQKLMMNYLYDSYKDNIEDLYKDEFKKTLGLASSGIQKTSNTNTFGVVTSEGYSMINRTNGNGSS
jgi:hypothetical protein